MTSGGARNRSGPGADPNSATSESKGLAYNLLPREGFTGRVPAWPLTKASARERAVWNRLWRKPQAAMWAKETWRIDTVGLYCRMFVRAEDPEAGTGVHAQLHRFADQIGLTPAGMKENGWRLATDELATKRGQNAAATASAKPKAVPTERRLRATK